ncbi:DUF5990 family protein [Hamadaea tsunoensis]|uniref:DUF5990 family protein n=1 Tax=Hamadaea tsunoensis TaxID=53368 RepID=UPI00042A4F34|nr:DUF5990 family protein [Hamadaea tsunoensis]
MRIRIEGHDLPGLNCGPGTNNFPGYDNIHVGVQRKDKPGDLLDPQPGDAGHVTWDLDTTAATMLDGRLDVRGPYISGAPGGRFIYLSWGSLDSAGGFGMFRRAKLQLDAVDPDTARTALDTGLLTGTLGLTDRHGHPLCASVRPPVITWTA